MKAYLVTEGELVNERQRVTEGESVARKDKAGKEREREKILRITQGLIFIYLLILVLLKEI